MSGLAIKSKASALNARFGITNFSASNGWLDGFKTRFQISARTPRIATQFPDAGVEVGVDQDAADEPVHGPHMCETPGSDVMLGVTFDVQTTS